MTAIDHQPTTTTAGASWLRSVVAWFGPGEPRPVRGPFTRWPRATDGAIVVAVFAASLVAVAASAMGEGQDLTLASTVDRPAGALALLAVAAAALWWRRAHPVTVAAASAVIVVAWALAGYGDGHDLALAVAVYSVGRYHTDHRLSLATVVVVAAVSVLGTLVDPGQRVDVLPAILLTGLPWYVGRRVRNRGDYLALLEERAERLEADQLARARRAVADERARIARELHDVVAHRVSMMTVQAGAARTVGHHDPDAAVEAMADVEQAGRQALSELRHLLGVLRPGTSDPDHLGPQPGLADVPALVDQLAATGADVALTIDDLPGPLPAVVDLAAYRIVQESLTNIIKHAGANPVAEVTITVDHRTIDIDIANTTSTIGAGSPQLPASGYGIAGMRERATLLGGSLTTGPEPPNRYRVRARLPLEPEPT
jgi:signal transduction histidine kinase